MNLISITMRRISQISTTAIALVFALVACNEALGQGHQLFNTRQPVGEIGHMQVARRPELSSVFQPVLLKGPKGSTISIAEGSNFTTNSADSALVSFRVGDTYRLKVSNIPHRYGDVYPTVELIDRMHAPTGKEWRYPVPIDLTAEELAMALSGKFVTRVIYVEHPRNALGARDLPEQRYFEVMAHEDPLHVASNLGRAVAILRMGSLVPGSNGPTSEFLFGSPPVQRHAMLPTQVPYVPSQLDPTDVPAKQLKRDVLPEAPPQPDADADELPDVPEPMPEERTTDEEPESEPVDDEQPGFDEPSESLDDGDIFGTDGPEPLDDADTSEEDPFGDFE